MIDFSKSFKDLKRNILWCLFGCAREYLDNKYDWMCLKINEGGMGIHKMSEMGPAAYVASFMAWIQSDSFKEFAIPNHFENNHFITSQIPSFAQFSTCLHKFHIDPNPIEAIQKLRNLKLPFRETLQSYLTNILQNKRIQDMQQNMELKELEWWSNQRNDMSGQPLLAFPSMEPYIIRTSEFRTWLLHRYLIPMEFAGLCCDCSNKPSLDPYGLHLSCGCNKNDARTHLHDSIVLQLQSLIKYAGYWTTLEEKHMFINDNQNKQNRPDITINNPINLNYGTSNHPVSKVIIDVSFTCVLDGVKDGKIKSANTRNNALKQGTKAQIRNKEKLTHYKNLINALPREWNPPKYWIVPFVIQTTGFLHKSSMELLEKMVESATNIQKIPGINMLTYFKRRISCCLAKNLANTINLRKHVIISHSTNRFDRSFDSRHLMEINNID